MIQSNLPPVAILAGGLATRLRPAIQDIPKVLVEIAGRPFLLHQFELLRRKGIDRLVLCVGYLGEQIIDLVGDGRNYGLEIQYSFDGPELLGTAGALKTAVYLLDDDFFVLNGDTYLDCDYRAAYAAFKHAQNDGLMVIHQNRGEVEPSNILFSDNKIIRYDKQNRSSEMQHIDCGLGILRRAEIERIPEHTPYDLATIYQNLINGDKVMGFEIPNRYYEIGSLQGIQEAENYLKNKILQNE